LALIYVGMIGIGAAFIQSLNALVEGGTWVVGQFE
jgi:hypothetical protein